MLRYRKSGTAVMNAAEPWLELWQGINTADNVPFFLMATGSDDISISRNGSGVSGLSTPAGKFFTPAALARRAQPEQRNGSNGSLPGAWNSA